MSLRARLRLAVLLLVLFLALGLSGLSLYSVLETKFRDTLSEARFAAFQVRDLLQHRVEELSAAHRPPPRDLEQAKQLWLQLAGDDKYLPELLQSTMANSTALLDITIAGPNGRVITATNPDRMGARVVPLPNFADWEKKPFAQRLLDILNRSQNFEVPVSVGVGDEPVFNIRVIVSSVLLRDQALIPGIKRAAIALLITLPVAALLAVLFSNVALAPLKRISQDIERITAGQSVAPVPSREHSRELVAVHSKLNALGQQFRGAKEDVRYLRSNIEWLMEYLDEGVLLFGADGRLLIAGKSAERLLGRRRAHMMNCTLEDLLPTSTPLGAVVQQAVHQRRNLKDYPLTIEREQLPPLRLLVNVEPFEDPNSHQCMGTLVTFRDTETRNHIAAQLDFAAHLSAMSRLTSGVAHEIKNPLNAIAVHLDVLTTRLRDHDPEALPEVNIIASEITRLDRVVKTFLDFTRPIELRMDELDLSALVHEVTELIEPEARRQNIEIDVKADTQRPVIRGDRDLLKQAVINVVTNGVEAMQNGGKLQIQIKHFTRECALSVSDEGTGIPPEDRDKIFKLYFTTKPKGSGIGLAMTFRVVQLHNGSIDFASEPGKGTTFRMRFPLVSSGTASRAQTF